MRCSTAKDRRRSGERALSAPCVDGFLEATVFGGISFTDDEDEELEWETEEW